MAKANDAYDPSQDPEIRRGVRRKYRDLDTGIDESNANGDAVDAKNLLKAVEEADQLFDDVKGTNEATLDSAVLLKAASRAAVAARSMKYGSGAFDIDDFVSRLIGRFGGGRRAVHLDEDDDASVVDEEDDHDDTPLDWEAIGRHVITKTYRVPTTDFMLGPLSIEQKKRVVQKRARQEKVAGEAKRPEALTEEDIQRSENETTKNVAVLEKILEAQNGAINLFRFIINPDDFAQSVENLFYLSFSIRDGKCALQIQDGEPVIFICEAPSQEDYDQGLKKQQMVMELDMATWRRAIEVFNIQTPTIPTRPKSETRLKGKWIG